MGQRINVKRKYNKTQNETKSNDIYKIKAHSLSSVASTTAYIMSLDLTLSLDIPLVISSQGTFLVPPKGAASIQTMEPENVRM
jgi:hypothetical protein